MKYREDNPDIISFIKNDVRKQVWAAAELAHITLDGEPVVTVEVDEIQGRVTVRARADSL